jgi:hypothetical protein
MSDTYVVITSIFAPTKAVAKIATMPAYQLIVAGDKKSPVDWQADQVKYLSVVDQENQGFRLSEKLPFNH